MPSRHSPCLFSGERREKQLRIFCLPRERLRFIYREFQEMLMLLEPPTKFIDDISFHIFELCQKLSARCHATIAETRLSLESLLVIPVFYVCFHNHLTFLVVVYLVKLAVKKTL